MNVKELYKDKAGPHIEMPAGGGDLILSQVTAPVFSIADDAISLQKKIVGNLSAVQGITSADELDWATRAGVAGRSFIKQLDERRKQVTKPFRDFASTANTIADKLAAPVQAEMDRVAQHIALFRQQEDARVALAEAARQAEIKKLSEAAIEANKTLQAAVADMATPAELEAAINAEKAANARNAELRNAIVTTPPEVSRSAGSTVRKVVKTAVTDIHALYKARPDLVRLEPNAAAIRATVFEGMVIPGLRIWSELDAGFRAR
jgi:ribosomal protein S13